MTFTNPLLPAGQDPYVIFHEGWYYYCHADKPVGWCPIYITKSKTLTGLKNAKRVVVWEPPKAGEASSDIWAPELHYINNTWYIYFAAWNGIQGDPHKMYVLEAKTHDPLDGFSLKARIIPTLDTWGIDGTVFEYNDKLYYVWSGKTHSTLTDIQRIYISRMENPWTLSGDSVQISKPEYQWEMAGPHGVNEGPQILKRNGKLFLIYSASSTLTDDYCLGMLIHKGGDVLDPASWEKFKEPVLRKTESVFAPGHASFTTSPDGKEDWIVYHTAQFSGSGFERKVHAQPFIWDSAGYPTFGKPKDHTEQIPIPSGEHSLQEPLVS